MNALSNSQVIEAIGIDKAIIEDLKTVQGKQFEVKSNQFLTALVNKIVYQRVMDMDFSNPFSKYNSFPITYGDTIENIFVKTLRGHAFDPNATDPFSIVKPGVESHYVSINYEVQYIVTIQDVLIRRACLNEYGMSTLIEKILKSLRVSMEVDEYLANLIMLNNPELYANSTGDVGEKEFAKLDYSEMSTETEKAAALTKQLVSDYRDMLLPSPDNNVAGVLTVSNKKDLLVIIKQELVNHINLDYLTGVFNLDKIELLKSVLEVRDFRVVINDYNDDPIISSEDGANVGFVILDTNGFDNHKALEDGGMIYNPKGKYTNHFANNFMIISFRPDCQAKGYVVTWSN